MIATDKQIAFIQTLLEGRQVDAGHRLKLEQLLIDHAENEIFLTKQLASSTIGWLMNRPRIANVPVSEPLTPGVYRHNGTIYVVKFNKAKTHPYACKLTEINGERLLEDGTTVDFELVYESGAMNRIKASEKLTLAEGETLAIRYGKCIYCKHPLKAASSVKVGVGPKCRKYYA
jgi:hypothetical protein